MNSPMPTPIASFSDVGHGVDDRLAQAGEDEHEREHALEHDARHRRPATGAPCGRG